MKISLKNMAISIMLLILFSYASYSNIIARATTGGSKYVLLAALAIFAVMANSQDMKLRIPSGGFPPYMLCWFLASRNLSGFTTLLNQSAFLMPSTLPRIFQEALVLWAEQDSSFDINTYNVSVEVLESYKQFCTTHSFPSGSYWRYFFLGQGR